MQNNTIVTAGDANYLWGLFLLIASMRRAGMDEPVLVGTRAFDAICERVLRQFGNVEFYSLDNASHNLTCHKAEVMRQADTEYVTWADADALFSGNTSELLTPPDHNHIHVRRRSIPEMPGAFPQRYSLAEILPQWRRDVAALVDNGQKIPEAPIPDFQHFQSVSACFLSVAREQEGFLNNWHRLMMKLPSQDTGVVNRSLQCYHQLDESCLNAMLLFFPNAPIVTGAYQMDKDPQRLFAHFCGRVKPWRGWIPSSLRHYDATIAVVDWAIQEKLELPGPVPSALRSGAFRKALAFATAAPRDFCLKVKRKLHF